MKVNRRGWFGAIAGAAAAAPDMARSFKATSFPSTMPVDQFGDACVEADPAYTARKLEKIRKFAAGDFTDSDQRFPVEEVCPFAPLRSVSNSAKIVLRARRYEMQWRERTMKSALDALKEYDKTGFLRHLF